MRRRTTAVLAALAACITLAAGGAVVATANSTAPAGVRSAQARTGHMAAGRTVRAQVSSKPVKPAAAQLHARAAQMRRIDSLPAPSAGNHATRADVAQLRGPQTSLTTGRPSPGAFTVFKTSPVPASCSVCAQSTVNEPDTANSGRFIMQTSNWDIAFTTNGGASPSTWQYQNPYALDSSFCCDQTITSVPARNRFVYEGLDLGSGSQTGFDIAVTKSTAPTSWCLYHFTGASFGGTSGDILDYPKIAYANNNLYVTWNEYNSAGSAWLRTGLARLPLDSLMSCSGFSFNFLTRTDQFTFGLTYGHSSLDSFYWVSNWYTSGSGSGTSERIYYWPENGTTYFFRDIGVTAYNFSGGSCASQDGVVTNWCSRLDPRWETAWITRAEYEANANPAFVGDSTLGVAITAGPGGGDPFPYVIYEYFKLNALSFIQTSATFNDGFAFAYAGCAPDSHGWVGCSMSWGGGTGTTHYYPGGLILLQDDISPTQPWAYDFNLFGSANASAWGDYQVTQPFEPGASPFLTTEWAVNSSGAVAPEVVVWGRFRDFNWFRIKDS